MYQNKIHNLAVVEDDLVVGMLSYKDLINPAIIQEQRQIPPILRVEDVMTYNFPQLTAEATYQDALTAMATWEVDALPIIEEDKLVGIVTESDIIKFMNIYLHSDTNSIKAGTYDILSHPATQKILELLDEIGV